MDGFIFMEDRYFICISDPQEPKVVILDTLTGNKSSFQTPYPLKVSCEMVFYRSKFDLFLIDGDHRIYLIDYKGGSISLLIDGSSFDSKKFDFDDWGIYYQISSTYSNSKWHVWDLEAPVSWEVLKRK